MVPSFAKSRISVLKQKLDVSLFDKKMEPYELAENFRF